MLVFLGLLLVDFFFLQKPICQKQKFRSILIAKKKLIFNDFSSSKLVMNQKQTIRYANTTSLQSPNPLAPLHKSLYIVGRGVLTPLFYEHPPPLLYCLTPSLPVFKFCPTAPLPCHLQHPFPLSFLLSCFFGWMCDHATFELLFYLIWIYTCRVLVP